MKITKLAAVVLLFALGLGVSVSNVFAQARPSSKGNVLSINPLALAYQGPIELQYEFRTSPTNSWALRGDFWPTRDNYSAFGLGAAYRFYIADSRALTGLNVGPAANVFFFSSSVLDKTYTVFYLGGDIAYKWIFDQFAVEPMFGLRIGFSGSEGLSFGTGFIPQVSLNLGYAW